MPHHEEAGAARRAFTLVELLVVIGIIAVLIGILLPVMSRVHDRSNRAACLANLHTIGQSMIMYANAHKDRLPNENPPNKAPDYAMTNDVLVAFARDWVRAAATFHCPSDADPVPERIDTADYTLPNSARVSYDFYSIYWMPEYGPKLVKVKQAPFAWDLNGGALQRPVPPEPNQNHGLLGGNVLYTDGHADWQEQKKWDAPNWPNPAQSLYRP